MSMTDKEIALKLTKAYLQHLNARAQTPSTQGSHATAESVANTYKHFYKTVSAVDDNSSKTKPIEDK